MNTTQAEPRRRRTGAPGTAVVAAVPKVSGHAITVDDLRARYGEVAALTGIDLHVSAGTSTAVVGPAGAGKSTLLRCINRLHEETPGAQVTGSVSLGDLDIYGAGVELPSLRRTVAMVFAAPNLFPTLSIADNVAVGLRLTGAGRREIRARVQDALVTVGLWAELGGRLHTPAVSLALGHQQRLCIARTLVLDPAVVLMDDPCRALDPVAAGALEDVVIGLQGRQTIVFATRSSAQAARVAAQSVFLFTEP